MLDNELENYFNKDNCLIKSNSDDDVNQPYEIDPISTDKIVKFVDYNIIEEINKNRVYIKRYISENGENGYLIKTYSNNTNIQFIENSLEIYYI